MKAEGSGPLGFDIRPHPVKARAAAAAKGNKINLEAIAIFFMLKV